MIKRRAKSARKSRAKSVSFSGLVRKLDTVFSRYVRMFHADEGGTVECVTCGKLMHWKDAHAGHFIKRQHMSVRWDTRNVFPQCPACNVYKGGCQDEYARFLIDRLELCEFQDLMRMKRETKKWTRPELQDLISKYESGVREQEARFSPYEGANP